MVSTVRHDLDRAATSIGSDPTLVQGAGGNLSGKDGDVVWVKASGTRLGEAADRPIFVGVHAARAREEVLEVEDLRHVVVELADERASRPSIETALHVLLPHPFVFHVHAVGAVAAAAAIDGRHVGGALDGLAATQWVPYAKPGIALAHAVLAAHREVGERDEVVFVLGNHGLITAAQDADRALELVHAVEARLRPVAGLPTFEDVPDDRTVAGPGALSSTQAAFLSGGVLTPDEAVFLGAVPFGPPGSGASVELSADGGARARTALSQDAMEIARSFVQVARCADPEVAARYLDADEVGALVDWEAEKWRRGMER